MISKSNLKKLFWTLDLIVFTIVFAIMNYKKFEVMIPKNNYLYLYMVFIFFWILFSNYYERFNALIQKPFALALRITFWSSMLSFLFVVITISFSDLWSISRLFIVTFTSIMVIYSIVMTILFKILIRSTGIKVLNVDNQTEYNTQNKFYFKWLIPGLSSLLLIYICITYMVTGFFYYSALHEQNFLVLITSWGLGTLLTNRYKEPNSINHYYEIAPYLKGSILTILFITFFYYALRLDSESVAVIYKAGFIHSGLEIISFFLYFLGKSKNYYHNGYKEKKNIEINDSQKFLSIDKTDNHQSLSYDREVLSDNIERFGFTQDNDLTEFIWDSIKSENIAKEKVTILNSDHAINIELLSDQSKQLLINIHKLNDCRRINEYLLSAYSKLESGGLLVGNFVPLEKFALSLRAKMPHFLYLIILPFYFLLHRVFPKLTITKQIYFIITKGKNRVLSKSELLGRLAFCGYEIINETTIEDQFYFVCKKKKTVSEEKSPSYGPIVKLKRIGYNGEPLYIYKLRTMYPYSEFIQGDIYEKYHLDKSGKMKGDYRITSWGKIFRKYFLDEIPQIYNWLKGDLNLVGIRALSEHYFSLYPDDLKQKRINFKPGLIPPYYADLPESFDEIVNSEREYLIQKEKSPILTDIKYFFKASSNILLGARSK